MEISDPKTWLLLTPILIIQLVLWIVCLTNLTKKKETKYANKPIWAAIILLFQIVGSIAYLIIESEKNDSD